MAEQITRKESEVVVSENGDSSFVGGIVKSVFEVSCAVYFITRQAQLKISSRERIML